MALPPGVNTTYDVVRDWALNAAGFGTNSEIPCPVNPEVIDTIMLDSLQQVYSRVWANRHYQNVWPVTLDANEEQVLVAGVAQTITQIFTPRWRVIERMVRSRDFKTVYESTDLLNVGEATAALEPNRLCWYSFADSFAISPPSTQAETYSLVGYRDLNREIFTVSGVAPAEVITWQQVDLPDEFMEVYQKIVLGFVLHACNDSQRGQQWLTIASDELETILDMNSGSRRARTSEDGQALVMGGGNRPVHQVPSNALVVQLPLGS